MRPPTAATAAALIASALVAAAARVEGSENAPPKPSAPCATPDHRQLDFWIGDWDAFDVGAESTVVARARITSTLDGCALHELYEGTNGLVGQSFSIYDATRRVWHQTWVTNRGTLLVVEGLFTANGLSVQGSSTDAGGKPILIRAVWKPAADGVRETAETSADRGKTWKSLFDIVFRPHKP